MRYTIVGTAGHVDHGKTALIEALTGFSGDSLEEEKRRGITIDLSFSHLQNSDTNVAFIDVPGHEKLLKNMIAGAFGFDASLVVVDANEGLMPQTIEHLEILNLLHVHNIIIALTKSDLATEETLIKREKEIREYINTLENLEIFDLVRVSIYDKDSIEKLKTILFSLPIIEKKSNGLFRYYIDRSFSLAGVGQVVTGTVLDGDIKVEDKIYAPELEKEFRIKNLQVHDTDVERAVSSQRTAINLQGSSKSPLKRGTLLCKKGFIKGFNNIDVWVEGIAGQKIKHDSSVSLFIGTKQVEAKVLLLEGTEPIDKGFATLSFKQKLFLVHNEPFILSSSGRTVGGGKILNPINDPLKKKAKLELLSALKGNDFKSAFSILSTIHKRGFGLISSNQRFGLNHDGAIEIASDLDDVFIDQSGLVIYPVSIKAELEQTIKKIYKKNQYALLSPASLSLKIKWASISLLQDTLTNLCEAGFLKLENGVYKNAEVEIKDINKLVEDKIFEILNDSGLTPDAPYNIYDDLDIDKKIGDDALKGLTRARKVVRLAHNLFIESKALSQIVAKMRDIIIKEGAIDIGSFKKHFNISRKYLVAYLDYLDNFDDVKKQENKRFLA